MTSLPHLLLTRYREQVHFARMRQTRYDDELHYHFQRYLMSWRDQLKEYFLRSFYTFLDTKTKQPVWDAVRAVSIESERSLRDLLDDTLTGLDGDLLDATDAAAQEEQDQGYVLGLWALANGGVEIPDKAFDLPTFAALAAVGGLTYRDRLAGWQADFRTRTLKTLQAHIRRGSTLDDTLLPLDGLARTFERRVAAMMDDELYWQFIGAEQRAIEPYQAQNLWITADDEFVCPVCRPLHLTLTTLKPIRDTHPVCRCEILPFPVQFRWTPVLFEPFASRFRP